MSSRRKRRHVNYSEEANGDDDDDVIGDSKDNERNYSAGDDDDNYTADDDDDDVNDDNDDNDDSDSDDDDDDDKPLKRKASSAQPKKLTRQKKLKTSVDGDEDDDAYDDDSFDKDIKPKKRTASSVQRKKKVIQDKKTTSSGRDTKPTELLKRQQPKRSTDGKLLLTVGITGARAGDIIEGSATDTVGVVLRVVQGIVLAPEKFKETIDHDEVVASVAKKYGLSHARAEQWVADIPTSDVTSRGKRRPNHHPIGCGCHCGGITVAPSCTAAVSTFGTDDLCAPEATFIILQPGLFQGFAEDAGHGATLMKWVKAQTEICWRDLLTIVGKKTLILRPKLFVVSTGPQTIDPTSERAMQKGGIVDTTVLISKREKGGGDDGKKETGKIYSFELTPGGNLEKQQAEDGQNGKKKEILVRLPASSLSGRLQPEDVVDLVEEALNATVDFPSIERSAIVATHKLLSRMTAGGLKSALQKSVRFHAVSTKLLPLEDGESAATVPTGVFAAVAAGLLFADKGTFSPELQLFTRGATAILKRLAVILVEDVWIPVKGIEQKIAALLGIALATQRMPTYFPSRAVMLSVVSLAARATESHSIILWRTVSSTSNQKGTKRLSSTAMGKETTYQVEGTDEIQALEHAAKLLRIIRSFQGDMNMMDTIFTTAKKTKGKLPMFTLGAVSSRPGADAKKMTIKRPSVMRAWHLIDQHFVRGIGHLLPESAGASFKDRFTLVFKKVTGVNPRLEDTSGFEKRKEVQTVRFAQKYLLRFAARCKLFPIHVKTGKSFSARLPLDPGALSAGIGPIRVNVKAGGGGKISKGSKKGGSARDVLVILGVEAPEDEVCMLPPSRNTKDLYNDVTQEEQEIAIAKARTLTPAVKSPLLPGNCMAVFDDEAQSWGLLSQAAASSANPTPRSWSEYVAEGLVVKAMLHPTPKWATNQLTSDVLNDDDAIGQCLLETGDGVCMNAESLVRNLVKSLPSTVVLRARSFLRQQYSSISLPTPSLSGGLGSDQLMAYAGDWTAYRLLLILSRLVPGSMAPEQAPRFKVKNPVLLRMLEAWLLPETAAVENTKSKADSDAKAITKTTISNAWAESKQWTEVLARCNDALMEHQLDAVVRMDHRDKTRAVPGHFVVMDTGLGKTVTAVTYMLRRLISANASGVNVDAILWVTPKHTVPGLLKQLIDQWGCPTYEVKKSPKGSTQCTLKKQCINVVQSDLLRSLILLDLPSRAPKLAVVFDEVDTMYEPTQRTSACLRISRLCKFFVCQTATPMVKNVEHLATWLANTEQYPVDKRNFLVAASGMVSTQISLGIKAKEILHKVDLNDAVRQYHKEYAQSRNWALLAKQTMAETNDPLCDVAANLAMEDRQKWPNYGGVLVVANDAEHVKSLLEILKSKVPRSTGLVGEFEEMSDTRYAVIVVAKSKDRGYNAGSRLGAIVKGSYAGNGASRHQMRGRIRRIGQKRKEVIFCTVLMENSMLALLHERQKSIDSVNISLEALAKRFDVEVLGLLA